MKSKVEQKLVEFFASHPEATVVFVALGVLFTELEKANAFCGGAAGAKVITYTREQVEALDDETTADTEAAEKEAAEKEAAEKEAAEKEAAEKEAAEKEAAEKEAAEKEAAEKEAAEKKAAEKEAAEKEAAAGSGKKKK